MNVKSNAGCGFNHTIQASPYISTPAVTNSGFHSEEMGALCGAQVPPIKELNYRAIMAQKQQQNAASDTNTAQPAYTTDLMSAVYNAPATKPAAHTYPRMMWADRAYSSEAKSLTPEAWGALLSSMEVRQTAAAIEILARNNAKYDDFKKNLPVLMPHAQGFYITDDNGNPTNQLGGKRNSAAAIPSGLAMLDIDHVNMPADLFHNFGGATAAKANKIGYVGITASGHGLRVIAERQWNETIPQAQARLAKLFNSNYDKVTKDLARCSYCVPKDYVLYSDTDILFFADQQQAERIGQHFSEIDNNATENEKLFNNMEKTTGEQMSGELNLNNNMKNNEVTITGVSQEAREKNKCTYQGIDVYDIAKYIGEQYNGGQLPSQEGNRHNTYLEMAKNIKTICDYSPAKVFANLPDLGLSEQERTSICTGGYVTNPKYMTSKTPAAVTQAVEAIRATKLGANEDAYLDMNPDNVKLPTKLPKIWQTICSTLEPEYHWPAIISSLPLLGTITTNVRMRYLDNRVHSFSFMTCVVAPQSTGKSFFKSTTELLLKRINEESMRNYDAVNEAKEQNDSPKKNNKKQQCKTKTIARNTPINTSPGRLCDLQRNVGEKHIITITDEINDLIKNEKKGCSMSMWDIYILSFDNDYTGSNYLADNTFTGLVKIFYNLLVSGTPDKVAQYFNTNLTDGLMTRWCFAQLKREVGAGMPFYKDYTTPQINYIDQLTARLENIKGTIYCPWVDDTIRQLSEEWNAKMSTVTNAEIIQQLFPRALVKAFRAGYLISVCEDDFFEKQTAKYKMNDKRQMIVDNVRAIYNYLLRTTYELFGGLLEQQHNALAKVMTPKKPMDLLKALPKQFTREDFRNLSAQAGYDKTEASKILSRWIRDVKQKVAETDKNMYIKL